MSLRLKTILGIALIEGALLLLLIWMGLGLLSSSQEAALVKRTESMAALFATTTKDAVLSSDLASLESFTDEVMKNPGMVYARVLDQDDLVMAGRDAESVAQGLHVFAASAQITEAGEVYGRVELGMSDADMMELLNTAKSGATVLAVLEMSLVALFSLVLGTWLTRQIKLLEKGAVQVREGGLGHQVPVSGQDEMATTIRAFNAMSSELKVLYSRLERRLKARSSELRLIYQVSDLSMNLTKPLDTLLSELVSTIVEAQSGPEKVAVRIAFDGDDYVSDSFPQYTVVVRRALRIAKVERGCIELACDPHHPDFDAEHCESDKGALVEAVSQNLSIMIAHRLSLMEQESMEIQLRHAQKLEAVGQLAAGIAHEINTPTQFVNDNTRFLKEAFADYKNLLDEYHTMLAMPEVSDEWKASVAKLEKDLDIDYLHEEVPLAIDQSLDGLKRIGKIVGAMKDFSHPGTDQKVAMDLQKEIETTIDVSRNEWRYVAEVKTAFDPALSNVMGLPDEFKQVLLNMVVNAAHAIEEADRETGVISVTTQKDGEYALIKVSDNGVGMSSEVKKHVFDPFFTTKDVGKGTGQGLSIAYSIVVDKHQGRLDVNSTQGVGTEVEVRLPLTPSMAMEEAV